MVYTYLFPICYLEHLDSLRFRHAKRLMSWVRLFYYSLKLISCNRDFQNILYVKILSSQ